MPMCDHEESTHDVDAIELRPERLFEMLKFQRDAKSGLDNPGGIPSLLAKELAALKLRIESTQLKLINADPDACGFHEYFNAEEFVYAYLDLSNDVEIIYMDFSENENLSVEMTVELIEDFRERRLALDKNMIQHVEKLAR